MKASRQRNTLDSFCKNVATAVQMGTVDDTRLPIAIGGNSMSSLSESEAKEFHSAYIMGFTGFTIVAIVAHWLLYTWKPWF